MKKPVRSSIYERIEINFDDNKREAVSANAMEGCSTYKKFECEKCVYVTDNKGRLREHVNAVHENQTIFRELEP